MRRDRAHQAHGVGMARGVDHLAHRPDLDDAPGIHHRDTVRGLGDHAHVVGDEHHRRAALGAEALEERDDLRLDRDVERGGGLIGDEQTRLGGERERDDHALAHAARELVRIVLDSAPRRRECRPRAGGRARARAPASCVIGRCVRIVSSSWRPMVYSGLSEVSGSWKIDADLAAAQLRISSCGRLSMRRPSSSTSPAAMRPGGSSRPMIAEAGDRLAGARLADHAEHFARRDGERDIVERSQRAPARRKFDPQLLDLEAAISAASDSARRAASRPAG